MNGVSHMLPFVVGGGILIAIAFLIDGICVDMNALDVAERANFGTITPVAAWLKGLGGVAFGFMLPVLAGFIAMAVGDRPALALGFVGGMIASGGKSGFLGALAAGFAAGYIIVLLRKVCDKLPEFLEKIAPVLIYPLAGLLLMGLLMSFIVEPVMGGLNTALNHGLTGMGGTSKVILGLILGGMMAIDMGGPFNKAAYVFGTASIAAGNYDIMAAVMVGGMIASGGKSGFLGALAAGFAAGYIIVLLRKVCDKLPEFLEKIAPVLIYPLAGLLLMGLLMSFIVEPVMGGLNTALNHGLTGMGGTSKVILGLILGGMMAIDMGGPFNKAAYVFGTASIAAGNYDIMAAVMVGGMTPPCAIALASLLFKKKFTKEERESAPTNFIMGLAFITEGAIPFAASDPLHVLPACIVGSATAGAVSMLFGCTLMAPHGGIFVFPVVGGPLMYIVALIAGTLVSTLLLGILKKNMEAMEA